MLLSIEAGPIAGRPGRSFTARAKKGTLLICGLATVGSRAFRILMSILTPVPAARIAGPQSVRIIQPCAV